MLGIKGQLFTVATVYNVGMNITTSTSRPTARLHAVVFATLIVGALVVLLILLIASNSVTNETLAGQRTTEDRSLFYCIEDSAGPSWLPEETKKEIAQACVDQLATTP